MTKRNLEKQMELNFSNDNSTTPQYQPNKSGYLGKTLGALFFTGAILFGSTQIYNQENSTITPRTETTPQTKTDSYNQQELSEESNGIVMIPAGEEERTHPNNTTNNLQNKLNPITSHRPSEKPKPYQTSKLEYIDQILEGKQEIEAPAPNPYQPAELKETKEKRKTQERGFTMEDVEGAIGLIESIPTMIKLGSIFMEGVATVQGETVNTIVGSTVPFARTEDNPLIKKFGNKYNKDKAPICPNCNKRHW